MCSTKSIHTNFTCNEILILFEKKKKGNSRYAAKLICSNIEPTQFFFLSRNLKYYLSRLGFLMLPKLCDVGRIFFFNGIFFFSISNFSCLQKILFQTFF